MDDPRDQRRPAPVRATVFGAWMSTSLVQFGELEAKIAELGIVGTRVLFGLLKHLGYQNELRISQAELARELSLDPAHVNRAFKRLVGLGVLIEGPRVGVTRTYTMSPEYVWRGSAEQHAVALEELRAKRQSERQLSLLPGGKP